MRLFVLPLLLALGACGVGTTAPPTSTPLPPPAAFSDRTTMDEATMRGFEVAYKAARTLGEIAVDTGRLKGERAAKVAQLDAQLFDALGRLRRAYRATNSTSWIVAAAEVSALIDEITTSVKGVVR